MRARGALFGWLCGTLALAGCAPQAAPPEPRAAAVEPPAANPERNAYFGDLHLHTSYSFDAALAGTTLTPDDAYRFAQGEELDYLGRRYRREVPLDFLAVTDHAEYLGVIRQAKDAAGPFAGTKWPAILAAPSPPGSRTGGYPLIAPSGFRGAAPIPEFNDKRLIAENWRREIAAAERYNRPGRFTTFVAYEFSPMPAGHNHRNIIFQGPNYPAAPFSSIDSFHPEDLWTFADDLRRQGMESVMISHNSNLSDGIMFSYKDSFGREMTEAYAADRARNEIAAEMAQIKGASETTPQLSPNDEFAGFEIMRIPGNVDDGSYVRQALQRGMEIRGRLKTNPFKLGIVGGSDAHEAMTTNEEDNMEGIGPGRSSPQPQGESNLVGAIGSSAGLTGVWAESNTRRDIFSALKRKEIFGTSGPRIQVRMFGGWGLTEALLRQRNWPALAYRSGVPMGGDLPVQAAARDGPRFVVEALKDPRSGNLDRVQIVKLWFADGRSHEQVFDVAWSGGRAKDPRTGKLPPVGDTVDVAKATYDNSIGAVRLAGFWSDPGFDPGVPAIYYARVLEIPTPRNSTYAAARAGRALPAGAIATIQERAWTSPIFYEPRR